MPDPSLACLTDLVGATRAGSACFPLPTDPAVAARLTTSRFDLFLDALPGLNLRPGAGQTAATDAYARLSDALATAQVIVREAVGRRSRRAVGVSLYGQRGTLGGTGNGQLLPAGTAARLTLYTNYAPAGAFRILGVQLHADRALANVPLLLDGVAIGTLTSTGAAGQYVPLTGTPARILLDGQPHTLEAVLPADVRLYSNSLWCAPCQRGTPWGLALARGLDQVSAAASAAGFAVQVQEECTEPLDAVCYALSVDAELARSMAFAIYYTAGQTFLMGLTTNQQVSRYTLLEPKAMDALGAWCTAEAEKHLAWLAGPEGIGHVTHPCYACAPVAWHPTVRNTL